MRKLSVLRPSPGLIVAMAALVMAMSGAAIALPGKGDVKSNDIAKGAVKSKHIANDKVKSKHLKDGAVKGEHVGDDALDDSDLAGLDVGNELVRVTATAGADEATARAAAPENPLYSEGQIDIYAKCFTDNANGDTIGEIYARTSADGAMLDGDDNLPSADANLLNTATPEEDRVLDEDDVTDPDEATVNENEGVVASPDGTNLKTLTTIGVKQGTLAGGNGVFGDGDICLFQLDVLG